MSTDQLPPTSVPTSEPVWGAPQPRATWGVRQTVAAVGVAAAIAAGGGAAIYAASGSGSSPGMHAGLGPGGMNSGGPGRVGGADPMAAAGALHGEFVLADGKGGYTTALTQTGAVTAISGTSITARSADGYTRTYVIPRAPGGARPPFSVNDAVTVRATLTDQTATVTTIAKADPGGPPPPGN
ncbi:MAG: hypothetical protein JWR37_1535 [Mycobacterium sp.]|jgi:hypothetical protein|nr:hypothetical protein [Mycobacterium sp.]